MTIVVGSSSLMDGFMIADCQLTYPGPRGTFRYRDVCQKLFVTEYGVVVGIAGNVCLAKYIAAGLINYLDVHSGDRQQ